MSPESGDRMGGPTTRAGMLVWQFLTSQARRHALRLLWQPVSTPELLFQVWTGEMRRMFARDVDAQTARDYVSAALSVGRHRS
jgi:hypothetical protein